MRIRQLILVTAALASLTACSNGNRLDVSNGVGVNITRSACPAVAVPDHTGDITTFSSATTNARDIDVVANVTNVRSTCSNDGQKIYTVATFDVQARRTNPRGSRSVTLPYFSTVVRGGTAVVSKRVGSVTLNFADGAYRASAAGRAGSYVDTAAATLPADIRERITRRRKAGDADAAVDPLADPQVRAAIQRVSFEMLVGFQLTPAQLQYNATR